MDQRFYERNIEVQGERESEVINEVQCLVTSTFTDDMMTPLVRLIIDVLEEFRRIGPPWSTCFHYGLEGNTEENTLIFTYGLGAPAAGIENSDVVKLTIRPTEEHERAVSLRPSLLTRHRIGGFMAQFDRTSNAVGVIPVVKALGNAVANDLEILRDVGSETYWELTLKKEWQKADLWINTNIVRDVTHAMNVWAHLDE